MTSHRTFIAASLNHLAARSPGCCHRLTRLIVSLFFRQLVNVNTKTLPQNEKALKHQCLLLMDEFTSMGRVDIIAKAVAYTAGYNLRLLSIA